MRARPWIIFVALLVVHTARADSRDIKSLDGVATGARVKVEGVLSMRGSTPLTIMVLEVPDGAEITLKPHDEDIHVALKNLDGMNVVLEGQVITRLDPDVPRLEVSGYRLLALPGSGDPITGVMTMESGACVLTSDDGRRYWIVGDLAPALCQHAGARVWMVGKKSKRGDGPPPRDATAFTPSGYGVIE